MKEKSSRVNFGFILKWSTPLVGSAIATALASYVTYYATNVLGLDPIMIGTLLLASKIFDGATDLVAGFIVDHTNTKIGRGRPYDLTYALYSLSIMMIFILPNWGKLASYVVIFLFYTIAFSIFQTLYSCSSIVYLSRAVEGEEDQIKVNMFSGVVAAIVGAVVGIAFPQIIKAVGSDPASWRVMSLATCLPAALICGIRFWLVSEKKHLTVEESKPVDFRSGVKLLFNNKYILIFGLALLISNIVGNFSSANTYYFQYIVGDIGKLSLYTMGALIGLLTMAFYPMLTRKLGMKKLIVIGLSLGFVGRMIPLIAPANMGILIVSSIFVNLSSMPLYMLTANVIISCMDYGEWKTGIRGEGIYSCVTGFCSKIGIGLASWIVGLVTGLSGFDGMAAVQTQAASNSILMLFTVIPAVGYLLAILVLRFYKLDKLAPQIAAELEQRRSAASNTGD